jgi:mitochondrial import inner membrane translocase subunit TIM22
MSEDAPSESSNIKDPMQIFLSEKYRHLRYGPRFDLKERPGFFTQVQVNPDILFESCAVRGLFSCVAGFGLGLLMGGFFHTMQPMDAFDDKLSTWEQVRRSYRGFGDSCLRSAKGFAKVGLVYSAVECVIERERATRDVQNAIYGGCVTGALLAYQAGPQGMALGCAGFAAFSGIIEKVLNSD